MNTVINSGGKLAEPIKVENGVKQGGIPAPNLLSLYYAVVFKVAFKDFRNGVYIRYSYSAP